MHNYDVVKVLHVHVCMYLYKLFIQVLPMSELIHTACLDKVTN